MSEKWKDIAGYDGLYQVSDKGNVRSHKRTPGMILKQSPTNCGYMKVQLYKNAKGKMHYVHRLVAQAFLPNPQGKSEINHIDGNKTNNALSNLEWSSRSENQLHAIDHGLREPSPMTGRFGALNHNSRAIIQKDMNGQFIAQWDSIASAARSISCSPSLISNCLCGRKKTAKGFLWEYE